MFFFADYKKAVRTAIEVLEDYEIPQAPIDLQIIFDALSMELRLMTYADFMKARGKTRDETIAILDSELGSCLYNPATEQYAIYYNEAFPSDFCRFTIAHELGHYFLGHHREANTLVLSRSFIPSADYKQFENEANVFARNLLSPAPLASNLREALKSNNIINTFQMAFSITGRAAKVRADFLNRDLKDYDDNMKRIALSIGMKCQPFCWKCKTINPVGVSYCITCGNDTVSWFNNYKPLPPDVMRDNLGHFIHCPKCGHYELLSNPNYCIICGLPTSNPCSGNTHITSRTRHYNSSNAKFCRWCGSATLYNQINFYPSMEEIKEMRYTDGVEYDPNSKRVLMCPRCQNEDFSDNAGFCRICGTDLYNRCEGDSDVDNYGNTVYYNQHVNPSNARYCEICGKPTIYYKSGILKSYEDYQAELNALMAEAESQSYDSYYEGYDDYDPSGESDTPPESESTDNANTDTFPIEEDPFDIFPFN